MLIFKSLYLEPFMSPIKEISWFSWVRMMLSKLKLVNDLSKTIWLSGVSFSFKNHK